MQACHWTEIDGCSDTWFLPETDSTIDVYVDDFVMNADEKVEADLWKALEAHLDFGDPAEDIARHLGAYYSLTRKEGLTLSRCR